MENFTVSLLSDNSFSSGSTIHTHHHKDQMLGAGNTPTAPFMYETANKSSENVHVRSDYAAFTNCIQQSALLNHGTVDAGMDCVSLSSICDLKLPSPNSLSGVLTSDGNFKNLENSNLLFAPRESLAIDPKALQNCGTIIDTSQFLSLKPTTIKSDELTNVMVLGIGSSTATSANATAATTTTADKPHVQNSHLVIQTSNFLANNEDDNKMHNLEINNSDCDQNATNNQNNRSHNLNQNQNQNHSSIIDSQITTTSIIVTTANKTSHNNNNNNNNSINDNSNNIVNIATTTTATTTTTTSLHNIEELAASSSTSTAIGILGNDCISSNSDNKNNSTHKMLHEEPCTSHHNSSNLSSDCDSMSSCDEDLIDLDVSERGYQDTTSSHSQHSASGGGGGGSSGGGNNNGTNASNSAAGIALLNGVGGNPNAAGGYMTLLPPAGSSSGHLGGTVTGTSATAVATGESIDFKHLFEELCPVCGDKVSGYHYGLLTCESCKGFFKRTVQNKKVYTCVAERSCHIDKTQRKRCPYCRFQKCLEVGMKLEAVRADRMRGGRNKFGPMYKRDRARKLQMMRQRQLALQALRTSIGSADMKASPLSPGYQQAYPNMNIKQEIQIPQVSSLTQSPDSSPSPIAIALGQVNASAGVIATPMNGNGSAGGGGGNNSSNNGNTTSSDGINRSGNGNCHDAGTGSLQNTTESKLCFDSGTHPSSTADSIIEPLRVSPMIRDFVQSIDDREWQTQLFALLQKQTYNQVEVDLFELMCKVLDQNLFSQVDWARNTVFFKDLKVDDQMKLLQHSWSDMLVLDHLHQRIHNGLPDETQLNNGQVFNLLGLGLLGVPQLADYFNELQNRLQDLKFDMGDYVCMKFLILLNPDVRGIINKKTVLEGHENVQAALLDYTLTCYPSVTDKFSRLLNILPDIHAMAARGEEHLYSKHCAGSAPTQTLLMEMLHAKRKV